jgi:hypothetical protein
MKLRSLYLSFFILFLFPLVVFSQTGIITGVVKDAETGETLPFCNVFVNNTTISTVTDIEGTYTLSGLEPGPIELGFSFMGYIAETKAVTLNPGGKLTVNINLKPFAQELSDVEIKASRDKAWERDLRKFQNLFIGIDEAASKTQILNPWVIDFPSAPEKSAFVAKADQPIEIENLYLGYKITFNLKDFFDSPTNFRIVGAARFEELKPESETQRMTWEKNRADVYRKSPMNMFRALLNGTAEREGFYLYGDKAGGSASMNIRTDIFSNELGKSVVPYKAEPLVTPTSPPGTYFLNLKGRIEIHYQKGFAQANTYKDAPYPISWLEVNGGRVKIRNNGMMLNPQDVVFSGDMDRKRVSNLLPLDYNAEKAIQLQDLAKTAKNYQEKVYLHTDKPYYYAGDQLYFKGYFAYGNPYLRDELSKVLYVELINENRDFVVEKKFPIRDGIVVGDFYLPDTLSGEKYFIRAYTNWMRNYGPNQYFLQPLSVLSLNQAVDPRQAESKWPVKGLSLEASKSTALGPREKVDLVISTKSPGGTALSSTLSISVRDAKSNVPIKPATTMAGALGLESVPENLGLERFSYPIEKSLSEEGKVLDDKGKGTAAQITAFVNDFQGMINLETSNEGKFTLEEMEFYGPMKLAFAATDKKGKSLDKIELIEKLKAPVALPSNPVFPETNRLQNPIRSAFSSDEIAEELDLILVEDKAISSQAIYGRPNFVISGDQLAKTGNNSDLVSSLAAQIPGMRVTLVGATGQQQVRLRGGSASVFGSMEPIVMVNGTIMGNTGASTSADNLRSINPFNIDRIEVVTRMVPMLGDQGRNGVISVFLKEGQSSLSGLGGKGNFKEFIIEGFQPVSNFYEVDYSVENNPNIPDQRQTLFWSPYLVTDDSGKVKLSFYTNDQPGSIVVEVRGMTGDGELVYGTFLLNSN